MLTNRQIKLIRSLSSRKERASHKLFVAEGVKTVNDVLDSPLTVRTVYATKDFDLTTLRRKEVKVEIITDEQLKRISFQTTPNKVLALIDMPELIPFDAMQNKNKNLILLDNLSDPGNLGTLVRLAHWFGIDTIIASEQTVDIYNPKTIQASSGSFPFVKIYYQNLFHILPHLAQTIYIADLDGENIFTTNFQEPFGLLLGSESHGVDPRLLKFGKRVNIPNFARSVRPPESLNVAVSAAIILAKALGK